MLLISTCTPFRVFGKGAELATLTLGARLDPYSVISSPGETAAVKGAELAAFTIPLGAMYGPEDGVNVGAGTWTPSPRYGPSPKPMRTPPLPTMYCTNVSVSVKVPPEE